MSNSGNTYLYIIGTGGNSIPFDFFEAIEELFGSDGNVARIHLG